MAKPKLALIPAAQGSKLFSVLPSSGVGDFDFTRSGSATRINSQGLIETVASGVSRLNYPMIDGKVVGCPHHILEPERINLLPYSEFYGSGSGWSKLADVSTTDNAIISPDGTLNASLITLSGSGLYTQFYRVVSTTGSKQVISAFVKYISGSGTGLRLSKSSGVINGINLEFSNNGETLTGTVGANVDSYKIEDYGNKWFRVSVVLDSSSSTFEYNLFRYSGTGTDVYAIWGLQLEGNSSYPTSYIPTNGSIATRSAETANGSGDAATFNDSEGVLMAEISALANDGTFRLISLSDGTSNNRIYLGFNNTTNTIYLVSEAGGLTQVLITYAVTSIMDFMKLAIKYKVNDYSLYFNGFEVATDTSGTVPSGLNSLQFNSGAGFSTFYGNTKQLQYYNSALTDSELEQLTSWTSFTDMANGQLYTIE